MNTALSSSIVIRANRGLALGIYRNIQEALQVTRPALAAAMPDGWVWLDGLRAGDDAFDMALLTGGIFAEWVMAGEPQHEEFQSWLKGLARR